MGLFARGRIGSLTVRNRIVMAPMGVSGLADLDGGFSKRAIDYFAARARGGVGLIVTGACFVDITIDPGIALLGQSRVDSMAHLGRVSELCDTVHHHGAKIAIQLSPGIGRVRPPLPQAPAPPSASETGCFWYPALKTRELTVDGIKTLVRAYANAARIVATAGADAIEIHGYGGYLLDQFHTSLWNERTDGYGGDLEGRLRFSKEIIEGTRKSVGASFPLIFKMTADHHIEGGRDRAEALDMAKRLEEYGVDAIHVTSGCYESWNKAIPSAYEPEGCHVAYAEAIKKVVGVPVIVDGKLGDPELAGRIVEEGRADFIAIGRPLLADPNWAKKARLGVTAEIRPCICDLDGCMGRSNDMKYLSCTVNPATGNEREYALVQAEKPRSVLVVGGGPGGLEAARVAALRGHHVTLWEKAPQLGGKLLAASVPEFKRDLRPLIRYLSHQVENLGVRVELNKEATAAAIKQIGPEAVIMATGATPVVPRIPGVNSGRVFTATDVLLGERVCGEHVVVAGGGMVGCETAVHLARAGKKVTIVEMMDRLMPEKVVQITRMGLSDLVRQSAITVLTGPGWWRLQRMAFGFVRARTLER